MICCVYFESYEYSHHAYRVDLWQAVRDVCDVFHVLGQGWLSARTKYVPNESTGPYAMQFVYLQSYFTFTTVADRAENEGRSHCVSQTGLGGV